MSKSLFFGLGFITLFGFSFLGFFINFLIKDWHWQEVFQHGLPFFWQLPIGLAFGFLSGFLAWLLINSKLLKPTLKKYSSLISGFDLNIHEIIFISFCAGFGEEILFRACIQQYWGIWITAIFFVAIHGYLNPKDWRLSVYGLLMTLVIAIIGFMYEYIGLWSAIFAHFAIDLFLLVKLTHVNTEVVEKN